MEDLVGDENEELPEFVQAVKAAGAIPKLKKLQEVCGNAGCNNVVSVPSVCCFLSQYERHVEIYKTAGQSQHLHLLFFVILCVSYRLQYRDQDVADAANLLLVRLSD